MAADIAREGSVTHSRPPFVVFEGLDGAGKTTIARLVAESLDAVFLTTPCPRLRSLRAELLAALGPSQEAAQLFYLATVFAASTEARQHIAAGRAVVLDRYFLSTQAYAEFRGSCLRLDHLQEFLLPADVTVYVEAALDVRRSRLAVRSGNSSADEETLTVEADARLRAAHASRLQLRMVGRMVFLDTTVPCAEQSAARALLEIAMASPTPSSQSV